MVINNKIIVFCSFLVVLNISLCQAEGLKTFNLVIKEQSLGKMHPGIISDTCIISPDKKHVAYALTKDEKIVVVLDGQESQEYDDVDNLVFSPDSQQFTYAANMNSSWFVVLNGNKQKAYERLGAKTIRFSPDSKRLCYMVWEPSKNQQFVVVDGVEQEKYVGIFVDHPIFSSDSQKVLYGARKGGGKNVIVVNGDEGNPYDAIAGLHVSADSKHWAYAAQSGQDWIIVLDGKESSEKYDGIYEDCIVFSPDGDRLAYGAIKDKKGFVVVDGKPGSLYDVIDNGSIEFSPNSKRFAYRAIEDERQLFVVGSKEQKVYDGVKAWTPFFSSDSQHFAYLAAEGNKQFIVFDGNESEPYKNANVCPPIFNPLEPTVAYSVLQKESSFVLNQSKKGRSYQIVGPPVFSEDGKHLSYIAKQLDKYMMIIDEQEGKAYDEVFTPVVYTSDGQHAIYSATERDKRVIVVNNVEGDKKYDAIWVISNDSDGTFHFIAVIKYEIFLVRVSVEEF